MLKEFNNNIIIFHKRKLMGFQRQLPVERNSLNLDIKEKKFTIYNFNKTSKKYFQRNDLFTKKQVGTVVPYCQKSSLKNFKYL